MSDITQLAQELVRLGTPCVFGIPGEGPSLELLTTLEQLGCAFHLVSHEAAGALMAGGFGRIAGIPGVSLSIKGPGFSNMLAGIAANWLDRNPALSLSESYGPGTSPYRMHKRMAHALMVRPVVKAYADNPAPALLSKLWEICLAEEPGPVHIDISARMQQKSLEGLVTEGESRHHLPPEVIQRIKAAQRPVVIAGTLATRSIWRQKLAMLKIPIFTTVAGKGAIDETLPYAVGVFTNSGGPYAPESKILPKADLVVGLGLRTTEIIDIKTLSAPLLLFDELAGRARGLGAAAEVAVTTEGFIETLEILGAKEWGITDVTAAKIVLESRFEICPWLPPNAFQTIQKVLPESSLFFLDTGSFCTVGEHVLTARHPLQVMGSALGRAMGVALPTGVGAALAAHGTPVVVAVGDGGVRMYPDAITIAVQEKLPLLVLLMTDGYFSSIRQGAVKQRLSQNPLRLDSSCWTSVFQALGCPAERIESLAALEKVLQAWHVSPGPLFLELVFDADAYMAMTQGIR
jgi:acetolactate synthase-1/2/3 large subunit